MKLILKKADLERFGFKKTVEISRETDENGKTTEKKTIHYKVTDQCTKVEYWEEILAKRLPKGWKKWSLKTVKEVKRRIAGRKTKQCTFGLEIHPNRGCPQPDQSNKKKRALGRCGPWSHCCRCYYCSASSIRYA